MSRDHFRAQEELVEVVLGGSAHGLDGICREPQVGSEAFLLDVAQDPDEWGAFEEHFHGGNAPDLVVELALTLGERACKTTIALEHQAAGLAASGGHACGARHVLDYAFWQVLEALCFNSYR